MFTKSLQIIRTTFAEYSAYRLNFVLWRVRMLMQLLVVYFLWHAVFSNTTVIAGYEQSQMLTYILASSLVRTLVLSTTTMEIGEVINRGNLSNFLVKPLNIWKYYGARDVADKLINVFFAFFEVIFIFLLLRPSVHVEVNGFILATTIFAVFGGIILYFLFSTLLGFLAFWTPDIWAPRFLSFVLMEFFAGTLFPLDILPSGLFMISRLLPFGYLVFFPVRLFLGQAHVSEVLSGFLISITWILVLYSINRVVWKKGLQTYTAEGK